MGTRAFSFNILFSIFKLNILDILGFVYHRNTNLKASSANL